MNRLQNISNEQCKIVAFANRKGGVGKTSSVFHLAGCFAEEGKRVLLIDADPQHSSTTGIFGPQMAEGLRATETIAALFDDQSDVPANRLIRKTPFPGLSIVCGSDALTQYNLPKPCEAGLIQFSLRDFIEEIRDQFDLILIDNPPNIQLCTWASLVAADFALVISQPEDYGSQGCTAVQQAINEVVQKANPKLKLAGYVLNMFDRRLSIHKAFEQLVRGRYGADVFRTKLPLLTVFKEAVAARQPVTIYKPKSKAADAVRELAAELIERMETINEQRETIDHAEAIFPDVLTDARQQETG